MRTLLGILLTTLVIAVVTVQVLASEAPSKASAASSVKRPEPALPPPPPVATSESADSDTPKVKLPVPPPLSPIAKPPEAKAPKTSAGKTPQASVEPDAAKPTEKQARPNHCVDCHSTPDIWAGEQLKFYVTEKDFDGDIHWAKGLRCPDCHGGDPTTTESVIAAHAGFPPVASRVDVVKLCGNCHADIEYMRRFNPSPRVDQLREYWTSDHGQRLKEKDDPAVATCVSCHGKPHGNALDKAKHGVLAVKDPESPVFPTHVAETCGRCHSDAKLMAGRKYHDQPLGHDQHELWRQSVHAEALLKKGDLSAATCNSCHGNHGAAPPQVDAVANACGICHGKIAGLFNQTIMKHGFEKVGLPDCVTCHSNHKILRPTIDMLGMQQGAVCARCHAQGKFGATLAGGKVAETLRVDLEGLVDEIRQAHATIEEADQLGMEVSGPRFDLHKATDALQNARVQIHSFAIAPVEKTLEGGRKTAAGVQQAAEAAIQQYHYRRIWLAASLAPILLIIVLLLIYIRTDSESTEPVSPRDKGAETGQQGRNLC